MPNDLPAQTVPESFQVQVCGFEDNERAERMSYIVGQTVAALSRNIDLSRLAGVTIATDFDAALLELDRGFDAAPLVRTRDEVAEGRAMAVLVKRQGVNKWHIVLDAVFVTPLEELSESAEKERALWLLAHECAHVQILAHFDDKFPDRYGQPWKTDEEGIFLRAAQEIWDEYAANCLAGPLCTEYCQRCTEDVLIGYLRNTQTNFHEKREQFYQHKDREKFFRDARQIIMGPLKGLAYFLGNMDGTSLGWEVFPDARNSLDGDPFLKKFADPIHDELKTLELTYFEWKSLDVFAPLIKILSDIYEEMGIHLHRCPDGRVTINIK